MSEQNECFYEQDIEVSILSCLIQNISEKTFIDIGAEKGEISRWLIKQDFVGSLFEPLPKHHDGLKSLVQGTENKFFPFAIDDHDHDGILNIATDNDGNTMDYFHSLQRLDDDSLVHHTKKLEVDCRSINSLINCGDLEKSIGIFKTDTEGNDLKVLSGMDGMDAEVLMCEFFTEGMYNGWIESHPDKLIEKAKMLGFQHYIAIRRRNGVEIVSFSPSCFHEQEWGNLIFIKEPIFRSSVAALLEIKKTNELQLLERIDMLQSTCDERLKLINELHSENEKRLEIINKLSR